MSKLVILSPTEHQRFDLPPKFNVDDRALYFSLTNDELKVVEELRTKINKIGFVLQLGYFKAKRPLQRSPITLIKQVNQSLQPSDIQENVEAFSLFKEYL